MWRFSRNNGNTEGFHAKMEMISAGAPMALRILELRVSGESKSLLIDRPALPPRTGRKARAKTGSYYMVASSRRV